MLAAIAGLILLIWLIGLLANVAGGFVHILLIVAAVLLIMHFLRGGRSHTV